MKTFLLLLLIASASQAASLKDVEVTCWNRAVDDDGSLLCQHLMILGKPAMKTEFLVPQLAAPDQGGPKSLEQANRACEAMGYSYSLRFELASSERDELQITLDADGRSGELSTESSPYIQHLNCL